MRSKGILASVFAVGVSIGGLLLGAAAATAAGPPAGEVYFAIFLGMDGPYAWGADCLKFTRTSVCTSDQVCGPWTRTEKAGPETAFAFEMSFEEGGQAVEIDGRARVDDRGKKDSIAGVARVRIGGEQSNFGFTGRSTTKTKCRRLVKAWDLANNPTEQAPQDKSCVSRAKFVDPASSPYILPYPVGKSYKLSQTYCYLHSTHQNEYAYDFDMPLGAKIIAARAGQVLEVHEDLPNDNPWPNSNYLVIQHDDGTVAYYLHLKQDSVMVEVGDRVKIGRKIAEAAMSGTIDPHLHFVVYRSHPQNEGQDVSVNFHNAQGPVDDRGGLIHGAYYKALPW